jgi:predicted RNA polymerase sigma factor
MDTEQLDRDPHQCHEKQQLIHRIGNIITAILWIHTTELDAVAAGDSGGTEQFSNLAREALGQKTSLLELLKQHVKEHGCGALGLEERHMGAGAQGEG